MSSRKSRKERRVLITSFQNTVTSQHDKNLSYFLMAARPNGLIHIIVWSQDMITFCMITCVCVMIAIVLIRDITLIISWQYHRRSQVCVVETHWRGNFIWRFGATCFDVHILWCSHTVMFTYCDVHILWWSHTVMITRILLFSEYPFTSEQTWIKRRLNEKFSKIIFFTSWFFNFTINFK